MLHLSGLVPLSTLQADLRRVIILLHQLSPASDESLSDADASQRESEDDSNDDFSYSDGVRGSEDEEHVSGDSNENGAVSHHLQDSEISRANESDSAPT